MLPAGGNWWYIRTQAYPSLLCSVLFSLFKMDLDQHYIYNKNTTLRGTRIRMVSEEVLESYKQLTFLFLTMNVTIACYLQ